MNRTQIYLHDSLHRRLKLQARQIGISMSELIRRTLERDVPSTGVNPAQDFFSQLRPLTSFESQSPEDFVRSVRSNSRLLHQRA
jgi:negative regulator of replication initiation